jgi:hypothetical protein
MTTKEEFIDCTESDNGKKITFYDYTLGGSTKEISEGILLICDPDNKLIQFINDNPIDGSMKKYGEILYGQKQRWYKKSELRILKIEDLKEPLKKTEQDFYKQFLGKDVSFTFHDKTVIQGKISEVLQDRIKLSNNPKVFLYDYIAVPPAVESPSKDVEVRPGEAPSRKKGGKQSKSRKQRKSRKQHKSRKQRKSRK